MDDNSLQYTNNGQRDNTQYVDQSDDSFKQQRYNSN